MARDNTGSHRVNGGENDLRDDRPRVTHHNDSRDDRRPAVQHDRADEHRLKPAKTSAAAAFSLIFGVVALTTVLTVILAPVSLVLAVIGIILGIVGMKKAKQIGITGKGVAIGGVVLSVIALLLAITAAVGITTFLNNEDAVTRLENQVEQMREELPTDIEVPTP